jgi:RimJ/RimL family protein N-acetyltransferase
MTEPFAPDDLVIRTERLELRSMTPEFHAAVVDGDRRRAERVLGATIPPGWIADSVTLRLARYWLGLLRADPARGPWLARAMVRRDGERFVGHIGFHDRPGAAYLEEYCPGANAVEIGYTVLERYRGLGYATEAAGALMDWARNRHGITRFVASVSPTNAASLGVIGKFGFTKIGSQVDDEDGPEDVFERRVP